MSGKRSEHGERSEQSEEKEVTDNKYMARRKFWVPESEHTRDYRFADHNEYKGKESTRFWFDCEFKEECQDEDYVEPGFFVDRERL